MMISATAPMFTALYARIFLKEKIAIADILNLIFVFVGIVFIVKPPFIFGDSDTFFEDPEAIYAMIALIIGSAILQAGVFTILRVLKGKIFNTLEMLLKKLIHHLSIFVRCSLVFDLFCLWKHWIC